MINGGFGLVLDGTEEAADRLKMMLSWDVLNGVCISRASHPGLALVLLFNFLAHSERKKKASLT